MSRARLLLTLLSHREAGTRALGWHVIAHSTRTPVIRGLVRLVRAGHSLTLDGDSRFVQVDGNPVPVDACRSPRFALSYDYSLERRSV